MTHAGSGGYFKRKEVESPEWNIDAKKKEDQEASPCFYLNLQPL